MIFSFQHFFIYCFCFASIFLLSSTPVVFGLTKQDVVQKMIVSTSISNHFSPLDITDNYSKKVFDNYIEKLDPNKRFFTQQDISSLAIYKYTIDDQLEQNKQDFFNSATNLYNERLQHVIDFFPSLFLSPFLFETNTEFETDADNRNYNLDNDQLKIYWQNLVKQQSLNQYITLKLADVSPNESIDLSYNAAYEEKARKKIKKDLNQYLERLAKETDEDKLNLYNDSLINVFDVHSNYFPKEKKDDFDINISGQLEGIGAVLSEENGFIKVVRIVPGSASWRQGELKAEDIILKVAQDEEPDFIDIVGARVRDAVKLIRGKKGTTVRLMVKHVDGEVAEIPIVRDVVRIEETYAKHTIINDSRYDKRFGYIYLPKFYRDFNNAKNPNTTDDVKQSLQHLIQQGIDGIILDLRNNEGGALVDAINTAGLFIEHGPIVQIKGRPPRKSIYKDRDRSITYDGPLVILINNYSASASEILAAALQDYNRAIIVGSPSFGKGTVQTFVDLDNIGNDQTTIFAPLGSVKLTIQKFYRINGDSTQHKGVIPDIELPNRYKHFEIGERYSDNILPWDTVSKLSYKQWSIPPTTKRLLSQLSENRQQKSEAFQQLNAYIDQATIQSKNTRVSLNAIKAIKKREFTKQLSDQYDKSIKPFDYLLIDNALTQDLSESEKESYTEWTKTLVKDIQVSETCAILNDLVSQQFSANNNQ